MYYPTTVAHGVSWVLSFEAENTDILRFLTENGRKTTKQRLITTNSQDSEPGSSKIQKTYRSLQALSKNHVFQGILVFAIAIALPAMSFAGVFSFVQDLFTTSTQAQESTYHNSQTVPLLLATVSPDPDADKGGPEISFDEEETAIIADGGVFGSIPGDYVASTGKEENVYIVRPGDTLSDIAELFGVKAETIRWRNDIGAKEYIRAGQELRIPPADGVYHKIVKGDTIGGIAKKYSAETNTIASWNSLSDNSLKVGQEIFVPGGKQVVVATKSTSTSSSQNVTTSAPAKVISSVSSSPLTAEALGSWIWPVNGGIVTQGYANTSFANKSGYYKGNHHGGVDIGAPRGTEVLAAKAGTVTLSKTGYNGGYGNYVIITHDDGTSTRYGHNTKNLVKVGQRVVQGQVIATIGSTGRVTGPHLHFEIRNADGSQMEHNVFYDTYRNY